MSKCAVKRGIIALRDCGNEASDVCAECARPICGEHTRVRATTLLCVECYARGEEAATKTSTGKAVSGSKGGGKGASAGTTGTEERRLRDDWEDPAWPYYYRHHYYSTSYYHPFYYGGYYDSYYDDYDVRSFSQRDSSDLDADDSTAGGFYDS